MALMSLAAAETVTASEPAAQHESATYWAYRPVTRPAVPVVAGQARVRTPIDAFVLERLEAAGLGLASPAGRRELLRRAKFDLHGLPPTPQEVDEFLADERPDAYEHLLDRLLASPHYGERWGRIWLDAVRFADSAGYNADPVRPLAYKYRDYVIRALNADVPYDRFVQEQLAGDELFPESEDAWIATGFIRLPPDESNASDVQLARQDLLNDLTATVGAVFLGQSLGCAQCHDHKFDAIPQVDFYRLQAFFAGVVPVDQVAVGASAEQQEYQRRLEAWMSETAARRAELHELELTARVAATQEKRLKFPAPVLAALDTPVEARTALQRQFTFYAERQIECSEKELLGKLTPEQQERRRVLRQELEGRLRDRPQPTRALDVMAIADGTLTPPTHLLAGGSYGKPLEEVQPGYLSAVRLDPRESDRVMIEPTRPGTVGRRAALARWITDPRNPLTTRVLANRIWQGHFGRGLVENANDFGVQTPSPSHPALLDWLAAELVQPTVFPGEEASTSAWRLKRLHKLIMLSAVYRQAAVADPDASADDTRVADSTNVLYWHFPRRRLEAESLRDALLAVGGKLNLQMYGPGVQPELPPNYTSREKWTVAADLRERQRRSVYILAKRNLPYPLLNTFDFPDMHESCARRQETTTAPQALFLLNSELVLDFARAFAGRLLEGNPQGEPDRLVANAFELAFGREPAPAELEYARDFLERQQTLLAAQPGPIPPRALPAGMPKFLDPPRAAAVVDFCHGLLNTNEFLYVD